MIDKEALEKFVTGELAGTGLFLTDLQVTADNRITVEIDSMENVDIDRCIELTRAIEREFDRDKEDYELEVGSAGLTSPFKVKAQYEKNIGNDVECLTADGRKLHGVLKSADDNGFVLLVEEKVKKEGVKKPVTEEREIPLTYDKVKYTKYDLKFS